MFEVDVKTLKKGRREGKKEDQLRFSPCMGGNKYWRMGGQKYGRLAGHNYGRMVGWVDGVYN